MAHAAAPAKAEAVANALLGKTLSQASSGQSVTWTEDGKAWFDARKALMALVPLESVGGGADAGADAEAGVGVADEPDAGARSGGISGFGADGGDSSGAAPEPGAPLSWSGCGCWAGGSSPPSRAASLGTFAALALGVVMGRRRRR